MPSTDKQEHWLRYVLPAYSPFEPHCDTVHKAEAQRDSGTFSDTSDGIKSDQSRFSLYADDVLVFVINTKNSTSALISIIDQFGLILGYKIYNNKSDDDVRDLASFTFTDFPFS